MGLANQEDKRREREQRREGSTYRSYSGGLKERREGRGTRKAAGVGMR